MSTKNTNDSRSLSCQERDDALSRLQVINNNFDDMNTKKPINNKENNPSD